MEITGHKTASIFKRYHIVTSADKRGLGLCNSQQRPGGINSTPQVGGIR